VVRRLVEIAGDENRHAFAAHGLHFGEQGCDLVAMGFAGGFLGLGRGLQERRIAVGNF